MPRTSRAAVVIAANAPLLARLTSIREPATTARSRPMAARLLEDSRIVALARAACALHRALRLPFLRGRWRASHIGRLAAASAELGVARGEIGAGEEAEARQIVALRLTALLQAARPTEDGWNSLAEHLAGRAPTRPDRLILLPPGPGRMVRAPPPA